MILEHLLFPGVYFFCKFQKVEKNLIIFADSHHVTMPKSMESLYKALSADASVNIVCCFNDYQKMSALKVLLKSLGFLRLYAKAGTVVICDNFLPVSSCNKRKETKVVQLWHALGSYKKFGYDTDDDIPKYYKGNVFKNYDLVTVSGEKCVKAFESAMAQPKNVVKALGVPRSDLFLNSEYSKTAKEKFYKFYPNVCGKKVVLWCPTFRGTALEPQALNFEPLIRLGKLLGDDYVLVSKLHPHTKNKPENLFTAELISTSDLLFCADIMISDYSSIFFEWLMFDKPLVFFMPDKEEYRKKRGFYFPLETLPATITTNIEELYSALISKDCHQEKRAKFAYKYINACDGNSTQRIIDFIKG